MRLVREQVVSHATEDPASGPFRFERRESDRWSVEGVAGAFEVAGPSFGRMHPLRLRDFSDSGLGAISATPLTPGTAVQIAFRSPGSGCLRGEVVRCHPVGDGYGIAVRFDRLLAA